MSDNLFPKTDDLKNELVIRYPDGAYLSNCGGLWTAYEPTGKSLGIYASSREAAEVLLRYGVGPACQISLDNPEAASPGDKYLRKVYARDSDEFVVTDIYEVLESWKVQGAALTHAAKKVLCAGQRGHKDQIQDLEEAIISLRAAIRHLRRPEVKS